MIVLRYCAFMAVLVTGLTASSQQTHYLFDGHSLRHMQTLDGAQPPPAWEVVDGTLHLAVGEERGGHLVTDREFRNFRLDFEWKIAPGGNNGIKYRVRDYHGRTLGCEYQLIDDLGYPEALRDQQTTGALYDVFEPDPRKTLRPVGEYNRSSILVCGQHIEHWLNGKLIMQACVGDSEWMSRVAASKFNDVENFSQNRCGKIMLTDHYSEVWFRSIVLHEYPDCVRPACPWLPGSTRTHSFATRNAGGVLGARQGASLRARLFRRGDVCLRLRRM